MSGWWRLFVFFQAEDGIRDAQESRGLGDVYKRQVLAEGQHHPPSSLKPQVSSLSVAGPGIEPGIPAL